MDRETWRLLDECVADALELPAGERGAYLRAKLEGTELLETALGMVGQAEDAERFFEGAMIEAPVMTPVRGTRLGPWELERPLGSGGMGVVWLARRVDGQADMKAAIKLLPSHVKEAMARFAQEKQMLARLEHPNIARLLDAGAGLGETPNFVMEYVEGRPLMEFVRASTADRLQLFLKICDAVQYAHANLIIHRDLKPQNILVTATGEPKLLDFGIGKMLDQQAAYTLQRAFSLDYASPEQIRGGAISTATDVYSLGLILFEMMTGERARRWDDKALGEVLEEAERFALPRVAEMSADLRAVLGKATALEVERRYGSVGEFAADVARVMEGKPVEARPTGALYPVVCFARRNRVSVAAGVGVLVAIVGLAVWGWVSAQQAEQRSRELRVALEGEQAARRVAVEKEGLAREMEALASKREGEIEERLKELLEVFETLVMAARRDVARLPGGIGTSIDMLNAAMVKLERYKPTPKTRVNYLLLQAESHAALAELYGGSNSNVGDAESSKREREKAIAGWRELRAMDPGNPRFERGWIEQRFRRAIQEKGPIEGFEQEYLRLAKRSPKDPMLARQMGSFYFFQANRARGAERRPLMEKALAYFEKSGVEDDFEVARNVALAHKYLATLDKTPGGVEHARAAVRIDEQRVKKDPNNANARLDLGFSMVALGDAHFNQKNYPEALEQYWQGYELRKRLAMVDGKNVFLVRSLVYPVRSYGVVAVLAKDKSKARQAAEELEWALAQVGGKPSAMEAGLVSYWRGYASEDGKARCGYLREAERQLKGVEAAWAFDAAWLGRQVKACADLMQ